MQSNTVDLDPRSLSSVRGSDSVILTTLKVTQCKLLSPPRRMSSEQRLEAHATLPLDSAKSHSVSEDLRVLFLSFKSLLSAAGRDISIVANASEDGMESF
jgi:hypothetical protein